MKRYPSLIPLVLVGVLMLAFGSAWALGALDEDAEPQGASAEDPTPTTASEEETGAEADVGREESLSRYGLSTDTSKLSVDLDELLSGGPPKDGIPALRTSDITFTPPAMAGLNESVRGILVEFEGDRRFYPFSILVWHEIANDYIGDTHYAVTFCPLCGSGIVFDREVDGRILNFGVSGLLYESNLVMFDRGTESLWSQSLGEAIVGFYTGTELEILPMQLITFGEAWDKYPDMRVLSEDTGFNRDYDRNPYSGYESSDRVLFPISVQDNRFFAKELMHVFRLPQGQSVAFPLAQLPDGRTETELEGHDIVTQRDGGEIRILVDGERTPGYVEMWFSWATQHEDDGVVWEPDPSGQ